MTDEQNPEIPEQPEQPVPESVPTPQPKAYVPNTGMIPDWVKARTASCPYPGCENKINPAHALADEDTGTKYCVDHIEECYDCNEKRVIDNMRDYKTNSYTRWYCPDCYEQRFTTCPNCQRIVDKEDFLPPTRLNRWSMTNGGCKACAVECCVCSRIVDKDESYNENGNEYCNNCYIENFDECKSCGETFPKDDLIYVEDDGEYCKPCYRDIFTKCKDCEKEIKKSDAEEIYGEYFCSKCAEKRGPLAYYEYTKNFSEFNYTKKDRLLTQLEKLLPISVKDLKSKNPALASGLKDLISFSKGKPLTKELVKEYRDTLEPEEFPVEYTTWDGIQRSIDTLKTDRPNNNSQLVLNVVASPQMLSKLRENPALYDLFDKINTVSKQSGHPYVKDQIGWIRIELDPEGEYILIDEIQSDHSNAAFQLKNALEHSKVAAIKNVLKQQHNVDDKGINQLLIDKSIQDDDNVKALRSVYKIKYQITDAELDSILADKIAKEELENKLRIKYPDIYDPLAIIKRPEYQQDPDVIHLRQIYGRMMRKLDDAQLTQALARGEIPRELELQEAGEKMDKIISGLKDKYKLDDAGLNNLLTVYLGILNDFPNIASQAVSLFARNKNFKKIYWHTYESGKTLKQNEPPKSLYDKTPRENFFVPSENRPFGLEGKFFEREAKKADKLYKAARKLYMKCLYATS